MLLVQNEIRSLPFIGTGMRIVKKRQNGNEVVTVRGHAPRVKTRQILSEGQDFVRWHMNSPLINLTEITEKVQRRNMMVTPRHQSKDVKCSVENICRASIFLLTRISSVIDL